MTVITVADLKQHLRLDAEDTSEDALLLAKIEAAQEWVNNYAGRLSITYHPLLIEAVRQLAAHLYENREGTDDMPATILALLAPFRLWEFG